MQKKSLYVDRKKESGKLEHVSKLEPPTAIHHRRPPNAKPKFIIKVECQCKNAPDANLKSRAAAGPSRNDSTGAAGGSRREPGGGGQEEDEKPAS